MCVCVCVCVCVAWRMSLWREVQREARWEVWRARERRRAPGAEEPQRALESVSDGLLARVLDGLAADRIRRHTEACWEVGRCDVVNVVNVVSVVGRALHQPEP